MEEDKAIALGHPSYVWGFGQERRLNLIRRFVSLEDQTILDVGCGLGMYVQAMRRFSDDVYGVDVDEEKVAKASQELPNVRVAPAEELPYPDDTFDLVLSHEVIEHVTDDRKAVCEAVRVLKNPGGRLVIFAPNRLYPFETHGAYWGGRYHFGNIPFVNYLPNHWRDRFCPHVRAYTTRGLQKLFDSLSMSIIVHTQIFPGYDKIVHRRPRAGRILRLITYFMERTPLRAFGLSHFLVAERTVE